MRGPFRSCRPSACALLLCALVYVSLAPARVARTCPPPPSLSEDVESAALIMVGRVLSIETTTVGSGEDSWEDSVAVLKPETMLKGAVDMTRTVTVSSFHTDLGTSDELQTRTLLVFTDDGEAEGELSALLIRDVTDDEALEAYTARVRELLDILKLPEGEERHRRGAEWAVRCVESASTRRDGLQELHRFRRFWRDEELPVETLDAALRERLVTVMLAVRESDEDFGRWLAAFLIDDGDERVLAYLTEALTREAESPSDSAAWLMSLVAGQAGWRTGGWFAREFHTLGTREAKAETVRRFLDMSAAREELPEVLAALAAEEAEANSPAAVAIAEREDAIREAEQQFEFTPDEEDPTAEDTEGHDDER